MTREPFVCGSNGLVLKPDHGKEFKARATLSSGRYADLSPMGHWQQGGAGLLDALGDYKGATRADKADQASMDSADTYIPEIDQPLPRVGAAEPTGEMKFSQMPVANFAQNKVSSLSWMRCRQ